MEISQRQWTRLHVADGGPSRALVRGVDVAGGETSAAEAVGMERVVVAVWAEVDSPGLRTCVTPAGGKVIGRGSAIGKC